MLTYRINITSCDSTPRCDFLFVGFTMDVSQRIKSDLDFKLSADTERKVQDVTDYVKRFQATTEPEKSFCTQQFTRAMAVKYVYNSNIGERIGSQTQEDTKEIIDRLLTEESNGTEEHITKEQKETQNTYFGLKQMHGLSDEMDHTGLLTVQVICDVHKTLMNGLTDSEKCGKMNKK